MKWSSLVHSGICLPTPYEARGLGIMIRGKTVELTHAQEEMVYAWAKKIGTPYAQDPVFAANFLKDFRLLLPSEFHDVSIEEIDFSEIVQQIERERSLLKDEKKRLSAERRAKRAELKERFGYAWVDGKRTEVANWMAEPPGLFIGRGNHP